jgi:hypothetical protein
MSPDLESCPDDSGCECIGRRLQCFGIGAGHDGIVALGERDPLALQTPGDELMAVEPSRHDKGQKRADVQTTGAQDRVVEVKIIMPVA